MPLLILVVDDNPGIRLAISDYLELSGYSTIAAKNGTEALSLLESSRPHLMVADIKMPEIDGYTLVQKVRRRPEFRLLPVIFLTEHNTTADRIRGYQVGCDLYLPKPFEMEELGAAIRNLLERSQIVQAELRFSGSESQPSDRRDINPSSGPTIALHLTKREQEVLDWLTQGLSNAEIGNALHLSPRTIEKYVSSLLRKTDTNKRAELIRFALEHQLVR